MSNYAPPNFKIIFDSKKIAESLWITDQQALKEFKDGRVISRFSEYWTGKLYHFVKSINTNSAGFDGTISHPLFDQLFIGVRSLTKAGIKFQQSKFIGSGRRCNQSDLIQSVYYIDFEIVVDIIDFPCVIFSVVHADKLIRLINQGDLTSSGLNRQNYYKKMFNTTHNRLDVTVIDPYTTIDY